MRELKTISMTNVDPRVRKYAKEVYDALIEAQDNHEENSTQEDYFDEYEGWEGIAALWYGENAIDCDDEDLEDLPF